MKLNITQHLVTKVVPAHTRSNKKILNSQQYTVVITEFDVDQVATIIVQLKTIITDKLGQPYYKLDRTNNRVKIKFTSDLNLETVQYNFEQYVKVN